MTAGSSVQHRRLRSRMYFWFQRNGHRLLAADIICITFLFFMHLFTFAFEIFTIEIGIVIQLVALAPAIFIALSVVWKGMIPSIICVLGIVLMHNSVILPYFEPQPVEYTIEGIEDRVFTWTYYTPASVSVGSSMNFLLGVGMVVFSIIIAHKPSVLFTRNRPELLVDEWSKYPIWRDGALLADGHTERSVPVKILMTDEDRYLLWRYEYLLVTIYDTPYLVRPDGLVPADATVMKDTESGRVIGKARYTGFFM